MPQCWRFLVSDATVDSSLFDNKFIGIDEPGIEHGLLYTGAINLGLHGVSVAVRSGA